MRKIFIYILILGTSLSSCITIEDDPFVTLTPTVEFRGYVLNNKAIVNTTVNAGPIFGNPGNIPTVFMYQGVVSFYEESSGDLITSTQITGDGLTAVVESQVTSENYQGVIIEVSGIVSAYADKESDGKRSNDILLNKSEFYEVASLSDVISLDDYPVVTMSPTVEFQTHIRNKELYITSTVSVNPGYIVTSSYPIVFTHDGVLQIYDKVTGALVKSGALDGTGLTSAVTILQDTATYDGFVIIASGMIECTGDIASDGSSANDILISTAEFQEVLEMDLRE